MSLKYIRDAYLVPAYRGERICYTDHHGAEWFCTIKSARNGRLRVLVDDRVDGYRGRLILHPTYNIKYLGAKKFNANRKVRVVE